MRLVLLGLGKEVGQGTGEVCREVKVMDGWRGCSGTDTAETWGHSLRAAQNMHKRFTEMENFWILLPGKVWKQTVPQADKFMDNRFIQIEMELGKGCAFNIPPAMAVSKSYLQLSLLGTKCIFYSFKSAVVTKAYICP